jgi:hypothetical protein
MSRRLFVLAALVLLVVLSAVSVAPGASRGAPVTPTVGARAAPCTTGSNATLTANLTWVNHSGWIGPAPLNSTLTINVAGPSGPYYYNLTEAALRSFDDGQLNVSPSTGRASVAVVQSFPLAGNYSFSLTVVGQCTPFESANWTGVIPVYGAAGYDPLHVSGSSSSSYVTGNATYAVTVAGRPSGSTIIWALRVPGLPTGMVAYNQSSEIVLPLAPGSTGGTVVVAYPSGFPYATATLPAFSFQPAVNVSVQFTPVAPGSPTTTTLYANLSTVVGAPSVPGASIQWSLPDGAPYGVAVQGSLNGSPDPVTLYLNTSAPTNESVLLQGNDVASVPGPSGGAAQLVTLGDQNVSILLTNLTGQDVLGLGILNSSRSVVGGNLTFNVTATVESPTQGAVYALALEADWNGTVPWAVNSTRDWNGTSLTIPGIVPVGTYWVDGLLMLQGPNSSLTVVASAQVLLTPPANGSGSGSGGTGNGNCTTGCAGPAPVTLSLAASPSNGTAPLNVTIAVSASGGTSPYNLSMCLRGPSDTLPVTGICPSIATLAGWSGASLSLTQWLNVSGYYAVNATVSDQNGSAAGAYVVVSVSTAVGRPVLTAQASVIPPSEGIGATYSFVTTVNGGVAPYDIQWMFGDGTSGSALPGSTVTHTYSEAGTYLATLRVTDAVGTVVTSSVGPFTVTLPPGAGPGAKTTGLSSVDAGLLVGAAVVVLASLVVLALVTRWAAGRREALNWLQDLEQGRGPGGPSGPS